MLSPGMAGTVKLRSEEHTSELQSHVNLVCRLLLEKKKTLDREGIKGAQEGRHRRDPPGPHPRQPPHGALEQVWVALAYDVHFFFNDTATTEIYTLSLHDALPI